MDSVERLCWKASDTSKSSTISMSCSVCMVASKVFLTCTDGGKQKRRWQMRPRIFLGLRHIFFFFVRVEPIYFPCLDRNKVTNDIFKGESEWFTALEYSYQRQPDPWTIKDLDLHLTDNTQHPNATPEQPTSQAYIRRRHENEESLAKIKNLTWNY